MFHSNKLQYSGSVFPPEAGTPHTFVFIVQILITECKQQQQKTCDNSEKNII